jgi:hypothetical protein
MGVEAKILKNFKESGNSYGQELTTLGKMVNSKNLLI